MQSFTSTPKRNKKQKGHGKSPFNLLFVAFGFVCFTMGSFFFHDNNEKPIVAKPVDGNNNNVKNAGPTVSQGQGQSLLRPGLPSNSVSNHFLVTKSNYIPKTAELSGDASSPQSSTDIKEVRPNLSSLSLSSSSSQWMQLLLDSLKGQIMLTINALSKVHQWDSVQVDPALHQGPRKKVMFYMGWCAFFNMELLALRGGPGGEFVIWADLATGMAALGFELVFVSTICEFWRQLKGDNASSYDIIITDYDGIGTAENIGHFPLHHCKYFLVDGFGTQQPFNKRSFDLKRILTPYPFDNSNTPVHLITGVLPRPLWAAQREDAGILWAKLVKYLVPPTDPDRLLLQVLQNISKIAKLYTSLDENNVNSLKTRFNIGDNILAAPHKRNRTEFLQLMTSSRFLLGVGMPVDGPTALEAIAHGCVFINPIFSPPRQQHGKPTRFNYTSQHPFIEANFGPPHVYTIDILDPVVVEATVRAILASPPPPPLVHPAHTPQVYLENLRRIFYDTPCNVSGVSPKRHPGNKVYSSFTSYVRTECKNKACPDSVYDPPGCSKEMLAGNNTVQHSKVMTRQANILKDSKKKQPKRLIKSRNHI